MGAAIRSSAFIGAASKLITIDLHAIRLLEPLVLFAKQDSKIDAGLWDSIYKEAAGGSV
jgi:hypothetical protein